MCQFPPPLTFLLPSRYLSSRALNLDSDFSQSPYWLLGTGTAAVVVLALTPSEVTERSPAPCFPSPRRVLMIRAEEQGPCSASAVHSCALPSAWRRAPRTAATFSQRFSSPGSGSLGSLGLCLRGSVGFGCLGSSGRNLSNGRHQYFTAGLFFSPRARRKRRETLDVAAGLKARCVSAGGGQESSRHVGRATVEREPDAGADEHGPRLGAPEALRLP